MKPWTSLVHGSWERLNCYILEHCRPFRKVQSFNCGLFLMEDFNIVGSISLLFFMSYLVLCQGTWVTQTRLSRVVYPCDTDHYSAYKRNFTDCCITYGSWKSLSKSFYVLFFWRLTSKIKQNNVWMGCERIYYPYTFLHMVF